MVKKISNIDDYDWLISEYVDKQRSCSEIAEKLNTYPNKINRALVKFGITVRGLGESLEVSLRSGRKEHPTKGKERSQKTKIAISNSRSEAWGNATNKEKKEHSIRVKKRWDNLSDNKKEERLKKMNRGIRKTIVCGSKLEVAIKNAVEALSYEVQFHVKDFLDNPKLEVDLYLPELSIVIEVDGPSHFQPIWGQERLQKTIRSDNEKNGLILQQGMNIIRIKQSKNNLSQKDIRDAATAVENYINKILSRKNKKTILLEVEI